MKDKEIRNVILVENPSLYQEILRIISRQYMKDKEITNVILVENHSLHRDLSRNTSILLMKAKKAIKCEFCERSFSIADYLKLQIKIILNGYKDQYCLLRHLKQIIFDNYSDIIIF